MRTRLNLHEEVTYFRGRGCRSNPTPDSDGDEKQADRYSHAGRNPALPSCHRRRRWGEQLALRLSERFLDFDTGVGDVVHTAVGIFSEASP